MTPILDKLQAVWYERKTPPKRVLCSPSKYAALVRECSQFMRYTRADQPINSLSIMGAEVVMDAPKWACRSCGAPSEPTKCSYCGTESEYIEVT